jgi:tetratricopeptide (TPR) repeat protein
VQRGFIAFRRVVWLGNAEPNSVPQWLDAASKFASEGLALSEKDASALELRGSVRYFRWSLNQTKDASDPRKPLLDAEADLRAAVAANPVQATAYNALSYVLNSENRFADAKIEAQHAYDSDPYLKDVHKTIWRLFQNSIELANRTEAERWCGVGHDRFPDNFRFTECRLWVYGLPGQKPKADSVWLAFKEFLNESPPNLKQYHQLKGGMLVALALVRAGVPLDSAKAVAVRSRAPSPDLDPVSELLVYEAHFRSQIGDKDEAIKLMTQFYANSPTQRAFAKDDESWWWTPIREDPRWKALVGRSG